MLPAQIAMDDAVFVQAMDSLARVPEPLRASSGQRRSDDD